MKKHLLIILFISLHLSIQSKKTGLESNRKEVSHLNVDFSRQINQEPFKISQDTSMTTDRKKHKKKKTNKKRSRGLEVAGEIFGGMISVAFEVLLYGLLGW